MAGTWGWEWPSAECGCCASATTGCTSGFFIEVHVVDVNTSDRHDVYTIGTDTWGSAALLSTLRPIGVNGSMNEVSLCDSDGFLYFAENAKGTGSVAGNDNSFYTFDFWAAMAVCPHTMTSGVAIHNVIGTSAYVMQTSILIATNWLKRYDKGTDLWVDRNPSVVRRDSGFGSYGYGNILDSLYIHGGTDAGGTLSTQDIYSSTTDLWIGGVSLPIAYKNGGSGSVSGALYYAAGQNSINVWTKDNYRFASSAWSSKTASPVDSLAGGSGLGVVDNLTIVYGGGNVTGTAGASVYKYNTVGDSWTTGLAHYPSTGGTAAGI